MDNTERATNVAVYKAAQPQRTRWLYLLIAAICMDGKMF